MDIRFPHSFDTTDIDRLAMNEAGDSVTFDDDFMLLEYEVRRRLKERVYVTSLN